MLIPKNKLKAILRYFCTNTDPHLLGKTKLMKLLYFADFKHIKKYGRPITNDTYYHLEHGPIPSTILNLVNSTIDEVDGSILSDAIYIEQTPNSKIQRIKCYHPFQETDKKLFSESELEILCSVCKNFGNMGTKQIEEISHHESPWKETQETQKIDYSLASLDADCEIDKETLKMMEVIFSE